MVEKVSLGKIEKRSSNILSSPYVYKFRTLPDDLQRLRIFVGNVRMLLREDLPALINEVKELRRENKRLQAQLEEVETTD